MAALHRGEWDEEVIENRLGLRRLVQGIQDHRRNTGLPADDLEAEVPRVPSPAEWLLHIELAGKRVDDLVEGQATCVDGYQTMVEGRQPVGVNPGRDPGCERTQSRMGRTDQHAD